VRVFCHIDQNYGKTIFPMPKEKIVPDRNRQSLELTIKEMSFRNNNENLISLLAFS